MWKKLNGNDGDTIPVIVLNYSTSRSNAMNGSWGSVDSISKTSNLFCKVAGSNGTTQFSYGVSITAHAAELQNSYTEALVPGEHGSTRKPPGALSW